jgi:tellurite methyltransferase
MSENQWKEYYKIKSTKPPSKLLVRALGNVKHMGSALDVGAGALIDSKFLLEKGFSHIKAIDNSVSSEEIAKEINDPRFSFVCTNYDAYNFDPNMYDLVTAQWALPFNAPETFNKMLEKIKSSLKPEGVFVGQFFGINDEWNTKDSRMTFHSPEDIKGFFRNFKIIELREDEKDGTTAKGDAKHWHVFHIIAQKELE